MRGPRPDLRLPLAVGAMLVLWASAFPAIRSTLLFFSPGALALLRFLFASATLGGVSAVRGLPRPRREDLPTVLALGVLGITVYHLSLNYGSRTVTAGAASLLIASAPMITALLARLLLGERLPRRAWIGVLLGFGGIVLITLGRAGRSAWSPGRSSSSSLPSRRACTASSRRSTSGATRPWRSRPTSCGRGRSRCSSSSPSFCGRFGRPPAGRSSPWPTSGRSPGARLRPVGVRALPDDGVAAVELPLPEPGPGDRDCLGLAPGGPEPPFPGRRCGDRGGWPSPTPVRRGWGRRPRPGQRGG